MSNAPSFVNSTKEFNYTNKINHLEHHIKNLIAAAEELVDLMEDVRTGDYTPDSFTTQPMRMAIKEAKGE